MVICLGWGADLHVAQLMPLPLTVSCSSKSRFVLPSWYWLTWVVSDKRPWNGCCCRLGLGLMFHSVCISRWEKEQVLFVRAASQPVLTQCYLTQLWPSQSSVATLITLVLWDSHCHMCHLFLNLTGKMALKSVDFLQSNRQFHRDTFCHLMPHCVPW